MIEFNDKFSCESLQNLVRTTFNYVCYFQYKPDLVNFGGNIRRHSSPFLLLCYGNFPSKYRYADYCPNVYNNRQLI